MRSATTWIHRYLKSWDDVCLPTDVKETFFFDRRFTKGLGWYSRHFRGCQASKFRITVEVGPSYFHSEKAPARIRDVLGQIPLIVIYRNPWRYPASVDRDDPLDTEVDAVLRSSLTSESYSNAAGVWWSRAECRRR